MRAIWKGAISFGLVTIPVRLHAAVEERSLKFNQLHATDQGRLKYKRACSVCGREVPWEEIARGYEYEADHYVVLSDEDLDRGVAGPHTIDIVKFVPSEQIDPILFQRSYYLAPDGPGLKAYKLLAGALADDGRVALAKVSFRDKEHLATLRARDGVFVLETMYWPDEVRAADFEELDQKVDLREQELRMAKSLIDNMTGDWEPEEFHDEYRARLEEVVARKIEGKEVAVVEGRETAKVVDLIEALKASVEATAARAPAKKPATRRRRESA